MKTGINLQELATELDRQNKAKRDFVVNTGNMGVSREVDLFHLMPDEGDNMSFGMTELFHRQMGEVLQIPAKFYKKLQTDHTELLSMNVNGLLQRVPSNQTIRTMDGTARAFLSDRYRRLDNYQVAKIGRAHV